jgi:hypothetical protein
VIEYLQLLDRVMLDGNGNTPLNERVMEMAARIGVEPRYKTVRAVRDRIRALLTGEDWFDEMYGPIPPPVESRQWLLDIIQQLAENVKAGHGDLHLSAVNSNVEALYRLKYLPKMVKRIDTALDRLRSVAEQKGWL